MTLIKIFKFFIKKIYFFFLNRTHKVNAVGVFNNSIHYENIPIIDLDRDWDFKIESVTLISFGGEDYHSENSKFPVIESWVESNGYTFANNRYFLNEQYIKILEAKKKIKKTIEDELYVLPYYTSHFGHFSGEILGSLLYYLKWIKKNNYKRKLLILTASEEWNNFLTKFFKEECFIIYPEDALSNNYILKNVKILPRMSTWQNFQISKNILNSYLSDEYKDINIFLTTERAERITNIKNLVDSLKKKNFEVLNPTHVDVQTLLTKIRNCNILITEKASIANNLNIIREKPFYILLSRNEKNLSKKLFAGAGIHKSFLTGLMKEIYCDDDPFAENIKPYKKSIRVDINKLFSEINLQ
jgi:hypothetical protein